MKPGGNLPLLTQVICLLLWMLSKLLSFLKMKTASMFMFGTELATLSAHNKVLS